MKTFVLKYRDYRHGPDGVTLIFVNAKNLPEAMFLAEQSDIELMDGESHPLLDHQVYGENCVVGQLALNGDFE